MNSVMTAPNLATDPNRDLVRRLIDARTGYERLCGEPPTCIHLSSELLDALAARGYKPGDSIAGMKIVTRVGAARDSAICSCDENLFKAESPRGKKR